MDRVDETATITISWNMRRKCWEIAASGGTAKHAWHWHLFAHSTAALDNGTGYLLAVAVREHLEAELF
jgi:hypothetical protein